MGIIINIVHGTVNRIIYYATSLSKVKMLLKVLLIIVYSREKVNNTMQRDSIVECAHTSESVTFCSVHWRRLTRCIRCVRIPVAKMHIIFHRYNKKA